MATWPGWQAQLLLAAGLPNSSNNVSFLTDWHNHANTNCGNNPVDISLNISGASPCKLTSNPNHRARNYANRDQAAGQFAAQIHSGSYPTLLAVLRDSNPYDLDRYPQVTANLDTWGSGKFADWYSTKLSNLVAGGNIAAPRAHNGWADLRRSANRKGPAALRDSDRLTNAALRSLSRVRKVRT